MNPTQHGFYLADISFHKYAFDTVDHGILLNKLLKNLINGKVGVWIPNFLSNSDQYVPLKEQHQVKPTLEVPYPKGRC